MVKRKLFVVFLSLVTLLISINSVAFAKEFRFITPNAYVEYKWHCETDGSMQYCCEYKYTYAPDGTLISIEEVRCTGFLPGV